MNSAMLASMPMAPGHDGDDGHDQRVAIADMAQLMGDHARQFFRRAAFHQAGGDAKTAPWRDRGRWQSVGLRILRRHRPWAWAAGRWRPGARPSGTAAGSERASTWRRAEHAQQHLVGIPEGEEVHAGRDARRRSASAGAADKSADRDEQAHQGRHQDAGLQVFILSCSPSPKQRCKITSCPVKTTGNDPDAVAAGSPKLAAAPPTKRETAAAAANCRPIAARIGRTQGPSRRATATRAQGIVSTIASKVNGVQLPAEAYSFLAEGAGQPRLPGTPFSIGHLAYSCRKILALGLILWVVEGVDPALISSPGARGENAFFRISPFHTGMTPPQSPLICQRRPNLVVKGHRGHFLKRHPAASLPTGGGNAAACPRRARASPFLKASAHCPPWPRRRR